MRYEIYLFLSYRAKVIYTNSLWDIKITSWKDLKWYVIGRITSFMMLNHPKREWTTKPRFCGFS